MSEIMKNENNSIGYEYKDIMVKRNMVSMYADGYQNFGWKLEGTDSTISSSFSMVMKFKRDCKIRNKAELTRLQSKFEACVEEIETLKRAKVKGASAVAYTIGIVGSAFMVASVFAYLAGMLPLSIILSIPAFIGWIIPYFCYSIIHNKKAAKIAPLIDKKYDEVHEVCEKANRLMHK
ncbi:hypothetical protein SAMN05446037_101727 [Anaerovirgula multivorans]|uniref:Uncharacterized protein n=1 Tax=Anaerovirgula multivorans TaxID=312168 RepID=A0A239GLB2_9FIRM|nr:hypothetical protein [Anaerovirgula multivorans]SNS68854.1 hypothetical protein SAMN05446037_101727 [Anaerovirgula multivorans]